MMGAANTEVQNHSIALTRTKGSQNGKNSLILLASLMN